MGLSIFLIQGMNIYFITMEITLSTRK
jgi:hypothetical protein